MQAVSRRIKIIVLPYLGSILLRLIRLTMKMETIGFELAGPFFESSRNVIFAFWHGRQLMMPFAPYPYKSRRAVVLISMHRDGELISRTIGYFGFQSIRGSTTRGGSRAFLQMLRMARENLDLVITPDGPRGPRFTVQKGIIEIAKKTGLPIFPVGFSASKKKFSIVGTGSCCRCHFQGACS